MVNVNCVPVVVAVTGMLAYVPAEAVDLYT